MLTIPRYFPNPILRRCIKYLLCQGTHSDTDLWAEKPSNSRPSQHGPLVPIQASGLHQETSVCQVFSCRNSWNQQSPRPCPKYGKSQIWSKFLSLFPSQKIASNFWLNASPWEKGQEKETWKDTRGGVVALFRQPKDKTLGTPLLFNRAELWFIRHLKASNWPCRQFQKIHVQLSERKINY